MPNPQPSAPLTHVEADLPILHRVFAPHRDVQSFINWSPVWSPKREKWLKKPRQMMNKPNQHSSLSQAASASPIVGLVCSAAHRIIAIDVDDVAETTPELASLLTNHPTYAEQSPSGKPNRLRLLYSLPTAADKTKLRPKATTTPTGQLGDIELYNMSGNFVTLTGQHIPSTPLTITEITPEQLTDIVPTFAPRGNIIDMPNREQKVDVTDITIWLTTVPCEQSEAQGFLLKHDMTYHDYWLVGIMSLHATFGAVQGYGLADQWSQQSGDYDQEELQARWDSFNDAYDAPISITPGTYQWLFNEFSIQWPSTVGKTKRPKPDNFANFKAFLKYKEIMPRLDGLTCIAFMDGPDHAVYPTYYRDKNEAFGKDDGEIRRLSTILVNEAEPYGWEPTRPHITSWIEDLLALDDRSVNRFAREVKLRVDAKPYDPETEPDYLLWIGRDVLQHNPECIAPSPEFHEMLVRKWLLSLGRDLWPELTQTNPRDRISTCEGILILSSARAGIGKSSFGERLFPPEWEHLFITTKPRLSESNSDKDHMQKTIGKIIVDFDEAERVFNTNSTADLKAYLTAKYDKFRLPYGRDSIRYPRRFSCLASTNLQSLILPDEGTRRYWWLNLKYVDTYAMDDFDMYNLWRQIFYELVQARGKRSPYLLTASEMRYLGVYLGEHTTANSTEELLNDIYDFSDEGFEHYKEAKGTIIGLSMSMKDITPTLQQYGQVPKAAAVKNAIVSLLKRTAPDIWINRTLIKRGHHKVSRQDRYFMPIKRTDALVKAAETRMM